MYFGCCLIETAFLEPMSMLTLFMAALERDNEFKQRLALKASRGDPS